MTEPTANRTEIFNQYRPLLFSIAYRMLGSAMDAEDMVQDAFLRWQAADTGAIASPKSYLASVVTRLCIDQLRLASVQRETYIGPWLPEPILGGVSAGIGNEEMLSESLSMAFLILLESLSPAERAAFLLREVFEYEYAEIAAILDKTEANCRQMVKRAHERLQARRHRFEVSPAQQQQLVMQFAQACASGDLDGLLAVLDKDVIEWSDGGGKVHAALNPIYGVEKVVRFLLAIFKNPPSGYTAQFAQVNNQLGIILYHDKQPYSVTQFDFSPKQILNIYVMMNPDKLRSIPPLP
jgi:RNA polymerase sigma-70 factor (ECF subfamily)